MRSSMLFVLLGATAHAQVSDNYLVSTTFRNSILEVTPKGQLVRTIPVPWPGSRPFTEYVRDIVVHRSGDVYVFNGTFQPYLSVLRGKTSKGEHFRDSRWSTVNNVSYGGIAVLGKWAFVPDSFTRGGLFRFDVETGKATNFATNHFLGFFDVTIGQDGLLYALATDESTIVVFDPETLKEVRTVRLPLRNARGIGVSHKGHIYASSWGRLIYEFDATGKQLKTIQTANGFNSHDLDLDRCGAILAGNRFGEIYVTDTSLKTLNAFKPTSSQTFVAFLSPLSQPTAAREETRLGTPPNRNAFLPGVTSGPKLGAVWDPVVRGLLPEATLDFLGFATEAANLTTPIGTLLCDPKSFFLVLTGRPGVPFRIRIPDDCMLAGRRIYVQGGTMNAQGCLLANALDVTLGRF